ncbi:hypothetical protein CTheo_7031 [Ceratobasidium theobromae]|uniref:Fungal-type protein kinase domain-containing protein n=1 Tax=Ceratobasidium theobromae TaxID=1582974 RepID=A0A5N5QCY6_9AGAM|nr:hypothetical protein CTheo_7031 [Ceratobasidium theobromae]
MQSKFTPISATPKRRHDRIVSRPVVPNRRHLPDEPSKRQRTDRSTVSAPLPPSSPQDELPSQSATASLPATIPTNTQTQSVPDTPRRPSSASRSPTLPLQPQHSSRGQTVSSTLPVEVSEDAQRRTESLQGEPMKRADMELALRGEINGAVYQYNLFCEEFLKIENEEKRKTIMSTLAQTDIFNHKGQWTIDCTNLLIGECDEISRHNMYDTVAAILDAINQVAFNSENDQFRPVRRRIVRFSRRMDGDDPHDSSTGPDVIQSDVDSEGRRHWADVEFFTECKTNPNQLGEALMQLARYARTTFVNQIYRLHVFAIAVCGTEATFVRFDRSQILHSLPIDLSQDFQKFALAAAGLFALEPRMFGYNTDFYFWPPLTGQPGDHSESKELRVKIRNKRWRVVEVMCQRKCLIGRATLVLLLSRVKNKKQRVVLKLIWRDESRTDEGESLKLFKGYPGICQCKWSKVCESTSVADKKNLVESVAAKRFFPRLSHADLPSDLSNTSGSTSRDSRSRSAKLGILQRFAGICSKNKLHRDISEGNVLCAPLVNTSEDTNYWSDSESTLVDSDSDSDDSATVIEEDVDSMFNELPLTSEAGEIDAPTYEEYHNRRYNGEVKCIGKLYDLEFMVNRKRGDAEPRGPEKTGTPAFIAAQLLLATRRNPVQHTYLHDLESFFWVLVWIVATRVEPEKKMNAEARKLMTKLCNPDDQSLGEFKKGFITTPVDSGDTIVELDNGWELAAGVVRAFAEFLEKSIYKKAVTKYPKFMFLEALPETVVPADEDPWLDIKRISEVFFICMWSASLSLCFDNYFTTPLLCTPPSSTKWWNELSPSGNALPDDLTDNPKLVEQLCDRQLALICLVFFGLTLYCWNLVISLFRIFEKVKHRAVGNSIVV